VGVVGRRVETAAKHLIENDFENALIQLSIAIDATAKNKWPHLNGRGHTGDRIKKFLKEYETLILQFTTEGFFRAPPGALSIPVSIPNTSSVPNSIPEILYLSIRNSLLHGSEYSDYFIIDPDIVGFGVENGKPIFSIGVVYGLLFSVVVDVSNKSEFCDPGLVVGIGDSSIVINEMWGNLTKLEKLTGFVKYI